MTLAARIRRLSVAFHERTILHDITLDIPAEGITVLLGRSGSGKTTFLRALNRLNECLPGCRTSGEAELRLGGELRPIYAGRTGEAALSDLRRRVGMVFQTPNILPASIRQNMLLPLQLATGFPASEWQERMERSLTEVGFGRMSAHACGNRLQYFQGGSSNASALPARWRLSRKCCSSTNPRHPSIPQQPIPLKTCSSGCRIAIPSFSSPTGCRKPKEWPRGLSCLGKDICKVCFCPANSPTKQR